MYEFIKEKELENIVLEHAINRRRIEDKAKDLIKHGFEQIISRVLLQIKLYIENSNQFKVAERSYDKRMRLKLQYQEYLNISYDENMLMKEDIDVIKGIFHLVNQEIDSFPENKDNPLEYERMLIESTGLLKIKEMLNSVQEQLIKDFTLPIGVKYDIAKIIYEFILEQFTKEENSIIEAVSHVVEKANNIEEREEIGQFLLFLNKQENMLKNFIYFNFEIDQEWQKNHGNIEMNQVYIYPLKQLFHEIHTTITDINHSLNKKANLIPIKIKNIENIIETNVMKNRRLKELIQLVEEDKANSMDRILAHVTDEMRKISSMELKRLKKVSSSSELQSYRMIDLFVKLFEFLEEQDIEAVVREEESRILQAIITTLNYKYQALRQKDKEYHMKKMDFYLECENDYLEFREYFEKSTQQIIEDILQKNSEVLEQAHAKFNYMIDKNAKKNEHHDINYFSQEILFELRTFEDLMNQSVKRLEQSEDLVVQVCIQEIKQLYHRLLLGLEQLQIKAFLPKVGESFNGKFHEVLMVEEAENSKKGDILRSHNSGFIHQDQVLVRASVVVSK
jgi:molecular chaperone GrpE (heat shock protein)